MLVLWVRERMNDRREYAIRTDELTELRDAAGQKTPPDTVSSSVMAFRLDGFETSLSEFGFNASGTT